MSKYMPERMPDRISSIMYFQMVCQKLCQNSMSWWGSLEASLLAPSAWPLRKWLKLFSFGTWTCLVGGLEHFLFPIIYGNNNPNWLIFFRGVGLPPTSCFFSAKSHNSRTSPVDEAVVFCSLIVMLVIPPASSAIPRPWRQMPNLKAASQQVIHPDTFWHSQCQPSHSQSCWSHVDDVRTHYPSIFWFQTCSHQTRSKFLVLIGSCPFMSPCWITICLVKPSNPTP